MSPENDGKLGNQARKYVVQHKMDIIYVFQNADSGRKRVGYVRPATTFHYDSYDWDAPKELIAFLKAMNVHEVRCRNRSALTI